MKNRCHHSRLGRNPFAGRAGVKYTSNNTHGLDDHGQCMLVPEVSEIEYLLEEEVGLRRPRFEENVRQRIMEDARGWPAGVY
jgi:hypothetical protein